MLLKVPLCKTKVKRNSICHRASKLFNMLKIQLLIPDYVRNATIKQVSDIYHNLKDSYIQGNYDLVRNVFWIICYIPAAPGNSLKIIKKYTQKFVQCLRRSHRDSISAVKNHFFQFLKTFFVTFSSFIGPFDKTRQFLTCNVALCCKQISIRCSLSTYLRGLVEQ